MGDGEEKNGILIVEDSEVQAFALKRMLTANGYTARIAKNGAEGIALAEKYPPALIVSDILMPVMDGYEMCREIKEDGTLKGIPLILLTQLTEAEDVIKGLDCGAECYVTKPYDEDFLILKVKDLLGNKTQLRNIPDERGVEIVYNGKRYMIHSGRVQTMSLLLSTYENAVLQNKKLMKTEEELKAANERLGETVEKRTLALNEEMKKVKLAEENLRENEERLRTVMESANDAIISLGAPDDIYLWNKKAEEMFGYRAEEAIGKPFHELIVPERYREKARAGLKAFFQSGTGPIVGRHVELSALRRDSTEFPVEISLSAMRIKGQWHATGIIRDITERREAEEALKKQVEELERFKKATIQRELRMKELRTKLERLKKGK
ncbi:MAG: PAS domain S-box protein [Deltaproteobacteria bacterium]|nr:PAS domain S-box protein [Deltaproteobacteria bacterium]